MSILTVFARSFSKATLVTLKIALYQRLKNFVLINILIFYIFLYISFKSIVQFEIEYYDNKNNVSVFEHLS